MFSFFKNKSNPTPPGPRITSISNEHHTLNWATLLPEVSQDHVLETLCTDPSEKDVKILAEPPKPYIILATNQNTRSILRDTSIIIAFPYIKTNRYNTFQVRSIQEWSHVYNLEAVISVSYQDDFGINFFATDYALHADKYRTAKPIQVNITGLGYFIEDVDLNYVQEQLVGGLSAKVPTVTGISETSRMFASGNASDGFLGRS